MPAVKIIGCLLVLGAGGLAAFSTVRYERRRISVLDGWIDLIFYIRTQIDCYLTPLNEILAGADEELLYACMGDGHCRELGVLLQNCRLYLNPEAHRLLTAFARELGSSYREEQVKRCDYYISSLRSIRDKQMEELPAKIRVGVALCLCAALGIAILLW